MYNLSAQELFWAGAIWEQVRPYPDHQVEVFLPVVSL